MTATSLGAQQQPPQWKTETPLDTVAAAEQTLYTRLHSGYAGAGGELLGWLSGRAGGPTALSDRPSLHTTAALAGGCFLGSFPPVSITFY